MLNNIKLKLYPANYILSKIYLHKTSKITTLSLSNNLKKLYHVIINLLIEIIHYLIMD